MKKFLLALLLVSCEAEEPPEVRGGCVRTEYGTIEYFPCEEYKDGTCWIRINGEVYFLDDKSATNNPAICELGNEMLKAGVDPAKLKEIL